MLGNEKGRLAHKVYLQLMSCWATAARERPCDLRSASHEIWDLKSGANVTNDHIKLFILRLQVLLWRPAVAWGPLGSHATLTGCQRVANRNTLTQLMQKADARTRKRCEGTAYFKEGYGQGVHEISSLRSDILRGRVSGPSIG